MTVEVENPTGSTTDETRMFEVGLEGVVYTLVDVHDGYDADFERWYESDHFYAGGVLAPYVLSGRRWYASRALRENRFVATDSPFPDPTAGTNLATYFLTVGGLRGFYGWINAQLLTLRTHGRMFAHRTHLNTDGYRLEQNLEFEGASTVPPHVVGDHPFAGVFVTYLDASGDRAPEPIASPPPGTLALSFRPNVGSLTNESIGLSDAAPGMSIPPVGGAPIRVVMCFLRDEPRAERQWSVELADRVARLTGSRALWGGAFLPVVAGSRDHLSQIR